MKKRNACRRGFRYIMCFALALVMLALSACNGVVEVTEGATEASTKEPVMVTAIRVKQDVTEGSALGVKMLEAVEVDENTLGEGYLTKVTDATGRKLLVDVAAGEFLTESMLEAKADKEEQNNTTVDTQTAKDKGYVVVTDYIMNVGSSDVTADIQKIIDELTIAENAEKLKEME